MHEPSLLLDRFRECHALLDGHFRLSSGLHSPHYFQCALLFDDPQFGRRLGESLADAVRGTGLGDVARVIGPALGGVIVAYELAAALGVRNAFAERDGDGCMRLRRGFGVAPGERIVVCEDVVTTGGSAAEVVAMLRMLGATPVAVACVVDRSGGQHRLDLPLISLVQVEALSWEADHCPMCAAGGTPTKPGSRPTA